MVRASCTYSANQRHGFEGTIKEHSNAKISNSVVLIHIMDLIQEMHYYINI